MPALVVTRIKLCSSLCLTVVLSWPKVKELQTLWGHSAFTKENVSCVIILFLKLQLHHILFPFSPYISSYTPFISDSWPFLINSVTYICVHV